ncbi:putative polyketide hydroxylase [Pectinophora gossypiella]|uniref:putative polyketide hydroxylase n=1 Tax=Pectinophora gossypiella TaxID=13191 RepID=UPI00214E666C|nr:putative polyketide hydroxylase [Pectinophora gossypiella]
MTAAGDYPGRRELLLTPLLRAAGAGAGAGSAPTGAAGAGAAAGEAERRRLAAVAAYRAHKAARRQQPSLASQKREPDMCGGGSRRPALGRPPGARRRAGARRGPLRPGPAGGRCRPGPAGGRQAPGARPGPT